MNSDSLMLSKHALLPALQQRITRRIKAIADRDARFGSNRVRVTSYMENIGWPELFGFDMNRFLTDADFSIEMQLREKIFWADNSDDDSVIDLNVLATTGMYYDMTLFGQRIHHTPDGVPVFDPHPLVEAPDPGLIKPFDFYTTGDMPVLIGLYRRMCDLSVREYGGLLRVIFPHFHRGPLDVCVQMRGFDNFIADTFERPDTVHAFLDLFSEARLRFARDRQHFLGEPALPATTFVADDWVNIPFISPRIFHEFVAPVYRRIAANEGAVTGFHTCGNFERVINELLAVFPDIHRIEISGWNDVLRLDEVVSPQVGFDLSIINTLVLAGSEEDQRQVLEKMALVSSHRRVQLCAQAMVKMVSYDDTISRMNRFIALARKIFASASPA